MVMFFIHSKTLHTPPIHNHLCRVIENRSDLYVTALILLSNRTTDTDALLARTDAVIPDDQLFGTKTLTEQGQKEF